MVIEITFFNQNFAENESDMKMFNTLLVVGIATALLVTGGTFIHKITLQIHPNSFLDGMAKYQLFALTVAVLATLTTLVLLFSLTNSMTEELIFRFGIVGGLFNHYPKLTILIISAILFGLPHYFGFPNGFMGVLMSGVLGYILCKATI